MSAVQDCVHAVRTHQRQQWLRRCISYGLVAGGMLGCFAAVARAMADGAVAWTWVAAGLLLGPALGAVVALLRPHPIREAAVAIDRHYRLKDRVATALHFLGDDQPSAMRTLQVRDAESRMGSVDPAEVFPRASRRPWIAGWALTAAALLITLSTGGPEVVAAGVVANPVVLAQADKLEDDLQALKLFQTEEPDAELRELLQELAAHIEDLKLPGTDPKEALATLSEMEASLMEQQQQLALADASASLEQIGDALALATPFQPAGLAMSAGDMDRAAEELAQLEMPDLPPETERALLEKLQQIQDGSDGNAGRRLDQAVAQLAAGLSAGDRSRFKDGVEGLAGECQRQGRRKKLVDLLRSQCQSLAECKGECEGEAKSMAQSNKKGGSNWGLGASGNPDGENTARLPTGPQMQITGQESAQGEVEVETVSSSRHDETAVREYRTQAQKYEQLSESVLSSEPIPLGHRQTIRRYFEMIRPEAAEVDAVLEATRPPDQG